MFDNAQAYDRYVGRWSRLVARQFIPWLNAAPGLDWLDVGSGTGLLTEAILQQAAPAHVVGVDFSEEYVAIARQRIPDDRVEFRVGDAVTMTYAAQFDVSVSGLVLNFVSSPEQAVKNMARAVKRGGIAAAYVWDYGGRMEMMRQFWDAAALLDPPSREMDSGHRFAIAKPDTLRSAFQSSGLEAVDLIPIDVETRFKDFDDYWLPFLGAQGSISRYFRALSDNGRAALRDQLQKQLPRDADGSIPLIARAWAVKGTRK